MPFLNSEWLLARALVILLAQFFSLSFGARMLPKLSRHYDRVPKTHFILSTIAWLFMNHPALFFFAFALIQLALWAEVVGVYWKERLR